MPTVSTSSVVVNDVVDNVRRCNGRWPRQRQCGTRGGSTRQHGPNALSCRTIGSRDARKVGNALNERNGNGARCGAVEGRTAPDCAREEERVVDANYGGHTLGGRHELLQAVHRTFRTDDDLEEIRKRLPKYPPRGTRQRSRATTDSTDDPRTSVRHGRLVDQQNDVVCLGGQPVTASYHERGEDRDIGVNDEARVLRTCGPCGLREASHTLDALRALTAGHTLNSLRTSGARGPSGSGDPLRARNTSRPGQTLRARVASRSDLTGRASLASHTGRAGYTLRTCRASHTGWALHTLGSCGAHRPARWARRASWACCAGGTCRARWARCTDGAL